jgi:hypothetical protein
MDKLKPLNAGKIVDNIRSHPAVRSIDGSSTNGRMEFDQNLSRDVLVSR